MQPEAEIRPAVRRRPRRSVIPPQTKERSTGIDIIKIVALILVVTVHSFLHTGFYSTPISADFGAFQIYIRWIAFCCVPLFMTVTGYLMSRKRLSAGYYKGILRVLVIYVFISIVNLIFNICFHQFHYSIWQAVRGLFMYTDAQYSWYVEYYFCIFLLIPFINQAYHGMRSKRNKRLMLMTFCFLFLFAQSFYIGTNYNTQIKIFPSFFTRGYPFAYYLIGAYLRDFPPKRKPRRKLKYLAIFGAALVWVSVVTFYQCLKNKECDCIWRTWHNDDYAAWPVAVMTAMLFLLLFDIRIKNKIARAVLKHLSNGTFAAYLISYLFDSVYYKRLNNDYATVEERFRHVPGTIAKTVFWSLLCGVLIQWGYDFTIFLLRRRKAQKARLQAINDT